MKYFFIFIGVLVVVASTSCSFDSKVKNIPIEKSNAFFLLNKKLDALSKKEQLQFLTQKYNKGVLLKQLDSFYLNVLFKKSNLHFALKQIDSSYYYDHELLKLSKEISINYYLARANRNIGFYFRDKEVYDSAFYYLNTAKNIFLKEQDSLQVALRLHNLAVLESKHSDYYASNNLLIESLLYLKNGDSTHIARLYNDIGMNYFSNNNLDEATEYYIKAIGLTNSIKDVFAYKNNLGLVKQKLEFHNDALIIYENLLKSVDGSQESNDYALILNNLVYTKWKLGNDNVLNDYYKALKIRKKNGVKRSIISSYIKLGEYFSEKNVIISEKYFDSVIQLSQNINSPKSELEALTMLLNINKKNIRYKDRYIYLKDSISLSEQNVQTKFAKYQYDDELEKEQIRNFEKDKILKNAELAEQRSQKVMYLLLSGLLLVTGTAFYFFLGQKHRKEKFEEVYSTEKRISKKIHDELANDIYGVMTNVQHSKNLKTGKILDKLENIYKRTRDISHQNSNIKTEKFHVELKKLLAQYKTPERTITVKGLDKIPWDDLQRYKKITVYRVLNELCVNMAKHSEASLVAFSFERIKNKVKIHYVDNGVGVKKITKKGIGILNTENQIHSIGGKYTFDSKFGKGISVTIIFPV